MTLRFLAAMLKIHFTQGLGFLYKRRHMAIVTGIASAASLQSVGVLASCKKSLLRMGQGLAVLSGYAASD